MIIEAESFFSFLDILINVFANSLTTRSFSDKKKIIYLQPQFPRVSS